MKQTSIQKISKVIGNTFKYNKALFAISSLGLGHSTRTLPIIKYYLEKNFSISIISFGNALNFLKKELDSYKNINFIELKDYPELERGRGIMFYFYLFIDILSTNKIIIKENKYVKDLKENFDFIFSDGRYGIYKKDTPSFLLSHQISFIIPKGLSFMKRIVDNYNYKYFKKFNAIFIPDFENKSESLALELSHCNTLKKLKHYYIGTLTSYYKSDNVKKDIDYYFIISGYLHEHKENFINKLLDEAKKLDGKKIFVLGDTSKDEIIELKQYNIIIYSNVTSKKRINLFNRAKIIITRSGYTTVMDLVANNKKAILFPTKNQTEQEYLAKYLDEKGLFINGGENDFDLKFLISKLNIS